MNELVTNSFKYAFTKVASPCISIESQMKEGQFVMTYRDNGPGLNGITDITELQSFGMRLVTGLAEQFNGTVVYYYDDGACFKISFSIKESK